MCIEEDAAILENGSVTWDHLLRLDLYDFVVTGTYKEHLKLTEESEGLFDDEKTSVVA